MSDLHPIIFSAALVPKILADEKTQTRRPIRDYPDLSIGLCPYGEPGDRLWVRETWAIHACYDARPPRDFSEAPHKLVWYRVHEEKPDEARIGSWKIVRGRWRPSIHMPRWASRITLEVTAVRAERLKDITVHDVLAEGYVPEPGEAYGTMRHAFAVTWDQFYALRGLGWDRNPRVWAVSFRRIP